MTAETAVTAPAGDTAPTMAAATRGGLLSRPWAVPLLVIALGTLVRIPQLAHSLREMHAFRQTQTAYVALEYARHGIDLLHTPLPIFGPSGDVPMELPLVQAAGALFIDAGVRADTAMRLVGLIGFQVAAVLVTALMLRWHGRRAAIVAIVLFQFSPFALGWGAASLIEFPAVACALGMVVGLDAWFRSGSRVGLAAGVLSAWLAFLVKVTTAPPWCVLLLVAAGVAYAATRSWRRIVGGLLAGPGIGLLLGAAWTRYADGIKEDNPLTAPMTSGALRDWNFGTLDQRLDPGSYVQILGRIGGEIAGPAGLGLLVAVLGIVFATRGTERIRRAGWLVTAAVAPLVFFNLYYVHNYYLIAVFPALVASVAIGVVAIAERVRFDTTAVAAVGTGIVLVGSAASPNGWAEVRQWVSTPSSDPTTDALRSLTAPDDLIVLVGCEYDPQTLYFADRRGLMFPGTEAGDMWSREDIDDYGFLYSCSPEIDAASYLPEGRTLEATSYPRLSRIVATDG